MDRITLQYFQIGKTGALLNLIYNLRFSESTIQSARGRHQSRLIPVSHPSSS